MTKKSHIPLATALFALLLLHGCSKMVDFDTDEIPNQMVLNALPSEGNRMFANFSQSRFFLDTNAGAALLSPQLPLTVYNNLGTNVYTPDSVSRTNYFFPYTPVGGDSLQLVIHTGGNVVKADTKVPKALQTSGFMTVHSWDYPSQSGSDTVLNICFIQVKVADHADESNYYYIRLTERDSGLCYRKYRQEYDTIDTVYNNMYFLCTDADLVSPDVLITPPVLQLPQGYSIYDRIICSDARFNGTNKAFTIMLPILVDTNEAPGYKHEFVFHVESIRPERIKYLLDVANATSLTQMFAEPTGIYSNVTVNGEQGLGLFSGFSHSKFPFTIEPWPYPENRSNDTKSTSRHELFDAALDFYRFKTQRDTR